MGPTRTQPGSFTLENQELATHTHMHITFDVMGQPANFAFCSTAVFRFDLRNTKKTFKLKVTNSCTHKKFIKLGGKITVVFEILFNCSL